MHRVIETRTAQHFTKAPRAQCGVPKPSIEKSLKGLTVLDEFCDARKRRRQYAQWAFVSSVARTHQLLGMIPQYPENGRDFDFV